MRDKIVFYYQKLSLIQKLSIPLLMASIFGFVLTLVIVKQVYLIDNNIVFLKNEIIPTLEKSNNNLALLKKISENLTFATLAGEEEMVLEINDNEVIEKNLKEIINNSTLHFKDLEKSLTLFQDYFTLSKAYALKIIERSSLSEEDETATEALLSKHNLLKGYFEALKYDVEEEITRKTALSHTLLIEVILYTITFIIVFAVVVFFTSFINYKEFRDYDVIATQRKELEQVNKKVQNSIEYAALMQHSILPLESTFDGYTKQFMICWKPKDTVGGDIYFVDELENKKEIIIMVIDGVGHGVSGGFLTILVKAIQTQLIAKINRDEMEPSPGKILAYFNRTIKEMLKQESHSDSNSGFDGGIMLYNRESKVSQYAGAKLPLYIVHNGKIEMIKGERKSVGFVRTDINQSYRDYEIKIKKDAKYYMITDGLVDQEGTNNRRYGKERFKKIILENHHRDFLEQKGRMSTDFHQFKFDCEQSDDITVLGMQFI